MKQGKSISVIYNNHQDEIMVSENTIRNYVNKGLFDVNLLDTIRPRFTSKTSKKRRIIKNTDLLFGRTYEDYLNYIKDNESLIVQLDTVVGKLIDKKKILTIHWPTFHFQIGILLDSLNPINVNNALIKLKNDIGEELYRSLFQTIVNISERAVKPFVIARKNFLFNATSHGASSSAIIFSLQQTARANLLDPEKYISKVLELTKPYMSDDELDSLLPWNIAKEFNLS